MVNAEHSVTNENEFSFFGLNEIFCLLNLVLWKKFTI